MELVMVRRVEREEVFETVASISQICNIALQVLIIFRNIKIIINFSLGIPNGRWE